VFFECIEYDQISTIVCSSLSSHPDVSTMVDEGCTHWCVFFDLRHSLEAIYYDVACLRPSPSFYIASRTDSLASNSRSSAAFPRSDGCTASRLFNCLLFLNRKPGEDSTMSSHSYNSQQRNEQTHNKKPVPPHDPVSRQASMMNQRAFQGSRPSPHGVG